MQWCMKEPIYIPKFIIEHYSVVKTDQFLVYIAQLDIYQFMEMINIFNVGTPNPFIFKIENSVGGGEVGCKQL